ncbi:tripartite tricarboxylate transporter substrate binding protein [Acuticoccus sp.]|uniref:tripartite tricarboxylate transporter substrate binding protein n=1 Tax=Acuticoccus sp. TaxID=1904378 RepID=UPI003B5185E0
MKIPVASLAATLVVAFAASSAAAQWSPQKTVEFVVPYSAGGGSDSNARMLVETMRQNDLVDGEIVVLNRPGGSGAVGNAYTFAKRGDGHTIMTFNSGQMMSTLSNDAQVKLENLTPLGTLALDTLLLVVAGDAGIDSFEDMVAAAEAQGEPFTVGGAARGSEDNLVFTMIEDAAGTELQYVPFEGSGETLSALLGGHINAGIFNPSEIAAQVEAGRVRPIGSLSEERLDAPFDEVPTFAEMGHPEATFVMFRGYVGPPDMPEEAVAYWEGVLQEAGATDMWVNDYVGQSGLMQATMGADESQSFYAEEEEKYRTLLKESGFME